MRSLAVVALLPVLALVGCGDDPQAATEGNFKKALNQHYEKSCIPVGEQFVFTMGKADFPYTVEGNDTHPWDALASAGLLSVKDETVQKPALFGTGTQTVHQKTYFLTETGKAARYRNSFQFCAGRYAVTSIDHFSEPGTVPGGGQKISEVVFHVTARDVPQWAHDPEIQKAFPELVTALQKATVQKAVMIQTNKGWMDADDFNAATTN